MIVTNHTVTIAAELVSLSRSVGERHDLACYHQENGQRLVGQCEISHPVRSASIRITFDQEELLSPVDDLDGTVPKPSNVLFEAAGKDEYEPLDARISRKFHPSVVFTL